MCTHTTTRIDWTTLRGYTGSVASVEPCAAAHGCIEYVEQCGACGAERWVAANGSHRECGSWSESRAAIADRAAEQRRRDDSAAELAAATAIGATSVTLVGDIYEVLRGDTVTRIHAEDMDAACEQSDLALRRVYRGLRRMASLDRR